MIFDENDERQKELLEMDDDNLTSKHLAVEISEEELRFALSPMIRTLFFILKKKKSKNKGK